MCTKSSHFSYVRWAHGSPSATHCFPPLMGTEGSENQLGPESNWTHISKPK